MGKRKYHKVYRDSSYRKHTKKTKSDRIKVNNCPLPRLLPYNKLVDSIKSINIGKLYSVRENLCDGLDEIDKVNGVYRNINNNTGQNDPQEHIFVFLLLFSKLDAMPN